METSRVTLFVLGPPLATRLRHVLFSSGHSDCRLISSWPSVISLSSCLQTKVLLSEERRYSVRYRAACFLFYGVPADNHDRIQTPARPIDSEPRAIRNHSSGFQVNRRFLTRTFFVFMAYGAVHAALSRFFGGLL